MKNYKRDSIPGGEGTLQEAVKQIVPGTMLHAHEIFTNFRENEITWPHAHYAADGILYFCRDSKPMIAVTRRKQNPVLNNLEEACSQLEQQGFYRPSPQAASEAIDAEDTIVVDLSDIKLRLEDVRALLLFRFEWAVDQSRPNYEAKHRISKQFYGDDQNFIYVGGEKAKSNRLGCVYTFLPAKITEMASDSPIAMVCMTEETFNINTCNTGKYQLRIAGEPL